MATKKTQGTDWANAADLGSSDAWAKAKPLSFDYSNAAREEETPEVRAPVDDRGMGISDTGYGLAKGGVDLVKDLSGVVAWGANAVGIEDDPNKGILDESLKSASDYLQSKKSEEIRAKEAELGRLISDDNYGVGDVAAYVASNPSLAIQMGVEALPGMVAMAAGGAGAASKLKFVESAIKSGGFKRLAATTGLGGGMEGLQMAGSTYNETQDSGAAAMALGLGVVTGLAPGNLVSAAIERGALKTGAKEGIEKLLLRDAGVKGIIPGTGRAIGAVAGEAGQEGIQSTGEALINQYGKGEELNFASATKEGVAGAIVGGIMGGAAHPVVGESGRYATAAQRDAHRAEVAVLAQQLESTEAEYRANPNEITQERFANAYSSYAALVTTPALREKAADTSAAAAAKQTLGAKGVDEAIAAFNSGTETSSILRTGATAAAEVQKLTAAKAEEAAKLQAEQNAIIEQEGSRAGAELGINEPITNEKTGLQSEIGRIKGWHRKQASIAAKIAARPLEEPIPLQGADEVDRAVEAALVAKVDSGLVTQVYNENNPEKLQAFSSHPVGEIRSIAQAKLNQLAEVFATPATKRTRTPKRTKAPEPAATTPVQGTLPLEGGKFNLMVDGIIGEEIPHTSVPGGNDAFQYARGRTEEDGPIGVFRRKASERGTYGGWRWEADPNKVAPEPAATNEPRHVKEMREKLGTLVDALPPEVRPIITHNYSGPSTGLIGVARSAQIHSTKIPATLESKGFTQKQWTEMLADLKEKVTGTRTEGVQAQIDKGTTVSEMLDYLIANTEPRMAKLAAALKRFGAGNPALDLPYTNLKNPPKRQRGGTLGWEGSGEITGVLNTKGVADEITTIHEITHALTLSWFYTADKKSPLYKELVQMHKDARNQWLSENPGKTAKDAGEMVRGLLDINEFMAEAVGNPQFQEYLMTVRANKSQSAWDKFVGWVRDLLGDPNVDLQMLGQALAAIEKIAKKSTAVNKTAGANAIRPAKPTTTSDAEHMSDVATSDLLQSIVADFFKSDDPNAVDDLIAVNEMFGQLSLDGLRNVRTRITDPDSIRLLDAVIARHEAGFDDAFDVINNHIELLEEADMTASMNEALGIEDDFTIPMGPEDTMDDFNLDQVPEYERRAFEATDRMFAAGSHAIISRTIGQSEQELRLLVRAAGNAARSDLAQAMLDYGDISAARVAVGNHLNDLMNNDILGAGLDDRNRRDSDPEPSYAKGGRHPIYDFGARLKNAYMTGALTKLASFWETVFESDGQFKINVDSKSILRGKDSTNDDYSKLMHAYNDAMFEKAKEWAKAHSFPEPKDSPANRVIVSLREQRNGQGKPELKLVVRGRGREFRGENPYLATTSGAGEGSMDFNPYSKQNEIHTTELEGFPGSGDIAYRLFADVANAHGLNLPTADTLMSNNNVRRPWQTVAATMRLKNPDVLSPINSGGAASAYGMDTELWPHLKDRERIGANILRHTHNMLVSRPGNRGRSSKIMVSNGRVFDNLAPLPNGTGFVAKFEPNHPNGVPKGTVIDFNELETRMQRANAIGGNTDSDVEAGRKGGSGTSMAFALMSQLVLDNIENNSHLDVDPTLVEAGAKMGRNREGWFFDKTDKQKSQLQEEIEAVRAFLADPKTSLEDQQAAREVLRSLLSDEIDGKISDLMEEHRSPMTSNGRRGEINRQIATLRMEQRAKRDTMVENLGVIPAEAVFDSNKKGPVAPIRIRGEHYSHQKRTELLGSRYGTGYKGAERTRIAESDDPRLRNRVYFYADAGNGVRPESGVGGVKHLANLANIYPAHEDTSIAKSIPNTITGDAYLNAFETAVLDAGYSGYSMSFGQQLAVVVFGNEPIPVLSEEEAGPSKPVVSKALADNPEAPLLNVGLDVGAGARTMKINPSTVKMYIERSGAKILRSNVVVSTYTHDGKEITENTFVAELDRPLTETEAELVSTLAQQEAIGQRSTNGNMLYGPKAKEWGAFDPSQFVLLDGTKMAGPTMTEDREEWGERSDSPVKFGREVALTRWYRQMENQYDESYSPDEAYDAAFAEASPKQRSILRGLKAADMLGFDYPHQAIQAVLEEPGAYEIPSTLKAAISRYGNAEMAGPTMTEDREEQINTPAFKKWFGDSKVVDAKGKPLVVYHGTQYPIDKFMGNEVTGWFSVDAKHANDYTNNKDSEDEPAPNIVPVYLSIQKPLVLPFDMNDDGSAARGIVKRLGGLEHAYFKGQAWEVINSAEFIDAVYAAGYDGVKVKEGGVWTYGVDRATQIKSAVGNRGTFDPNSPVITEDTQGPVSPPAQQVIIEQPVSPAHPNEVRIAAGKAHSVLEQVTKAVRLRIQDQHVTLGRIVQSLGIKAEDIAMDVIGALTRSRGLIQSNIEDLVKTPLANIENGLFTAGVKDHLSTFDAYLKYRHAEEANIQAAKINPWNETLQKGFNLTDKPGSGILTSVARAELAKMEAGPHGAALKQAGADYNTMIAGLQKYAVDRGLESQDTINAWQNVFPNYAPFNRDLDLVSTFSTGSQGASTRAGATQRFMGSEAAIQPILASTRLLGQRIVNRGEAARIGQALLNLATKNTPMFKGPDKKWYPMWKVDTYPNIRTVKVVNVYRFKDINGQPILNSGGVPLEMYNQASADAYLAANTNNQGGPKVVVSLGPQERVQVIQNPNYIARENVVIVPVNGENRAIVFNDQSEDAVEMYRNFKDMDTRKLGAMLVLPAIASRWIIATATGYNPVFSLFNFARDMQATAINMQAENIPGWTVGDSAALLTSSFGNVYNIFWHLEQSYKKTQGNEKMNIAPATGTPAWWMEKAKRAGGLTGIMDSLIGIEEADAQIRELFGVKRAAKEKPDPAIEATNALTTVGEKLAAAQEWGTAVLEGEAKDRTGKAIGAIAVRIANLNTAAELATRTAAFKAAYEKFIAAGKTEDQAATLAANISKGISVNFNRKGQFSAQAGALFPFFNAAAQGSARLAETIFNKKIIDVPDGNGGTYKQQVTTVTSLGWKLLAALPALGMLQALLLLGYDDDEIPEADKDRNFIIPMPNGGLLKIPLALGMNVPFNMGREGADMVFRPGNRLKHAGNLLMQPIQGFNPLGGAGNFIQTILPAITDPVVGLIQNRDAFNRPIAKEDFDKSKPTPGWTRAKEGATALSKKLAYGANFITGGGEFGIGAISPTPDQIDYTLGQITGGVGREVSKGAQAIGTGFNAVTGRPQEETPWYRVPLVGRLYSNVNEVGNVKAQIYAAKEDINALDYEHKQLLKAGERERATELLTKHPEIKLKSRIDSLLREESELRKQRVKLRADSDVEAVNATNARIEEKLLRLRDEIRRVKE